MAVGGRGWGGGCVPRAKRPREGVEGPMLLVVLFQPVPYSPPHCPFQVGVSAPPCPAPTYSEAKTDPRGVMTNQPTVTLEAPKWIALVSPLDREGEMRPQRD